MIGFVIWSIVGVLFICLGIYSCFSKKAVGFWANAEVFVVENVKGYNAAMAKLWCVFGMIFVFLWLPLLAGQNSPLVFISAIGVMLETIITMAIYMLVIDKKYRKK